MLHYFGGHTYEVIEEALSWTEARDTAKSWGGKLAQIESSAENAAVFKFLMNASKSWSDIYIAPDGGDAAYVWIGANDRAKEGTWKWSDGSSLKYTNWGYGGEPDDWQGQDAAAIGLEKWPYPGGGLGNAGQWNDVDVTNGLYALVEFDGLLGTKGNDTITGGSLSEKFDGGAGNDILKGAGGNDTMLGGAGTDRIYGGAGNDNLSGSTGKDTLNGDAGIDKLNGGADNDILTGGSGKDTFVFSTALGKLNVDQITDFNVTDDTIQLENSIFKSLTKTGALSSTQFVANKSGLATDKFDRIVYETDTGKLLYDADGSGAGKAIHFASIATGLTLSASDFFVI